MYMMIRLQLVCVSLITGRGRGQVKFNPYKDGGCKRFCGSFITVAILMGGGGYGNKFYPLKMGTPEV